ncbi:MAG: 2-hydroxymuconate tautomerase family protein [Firmicutes bacterium]|nr:2-hydroxymuconate tautomerase family protein [Bacillota bacterium]
MVIVKVHMMQGRTSEQKRKLIARITDVVQEAVGVPSRDVRVLLLEIAPDAWGIGGVPASFRS